MHYKIIQHSSQPSWLINALKVKQGTTYGQLGLLIISILSMAIFIFIVSSLSHHTIVRLNNVIYQFFKALYSTKNINACVLFTGLGDYYVILPATEMIGLTLLLHKRYITTFCWIFTIHFGSLLGDTIKYQLNISRPNGIPDAYSDLSFPSGHTLIAVLFYGFSAFLMQDNLKPKFRWVIWGFTITLITLISFSRLYLGMHWFIDIIGSVFLGLSLISFGYFCYRRLVAKPIPIKLILFPGFLAIVIAMVWYSFFWYT